MKKKLITIGLAAAFLLAGCSDETKVIPTTTPDVNLHITEQGTYVTATPTPETNKDTTGETNTSNIGADGQTGSVEKTEAQKKLEELEIELMKDLGVKEGQYFLYATREFHGDYYYGDVVIFNHKNELVASFKNATVNADYYGLLDSNILPIGIRESDAVDSDMKFGVYDITKGEFIVEPKYNYLTTLGTSHNPKAFCGYIHGYNSSDCEVVDLNGKVLIEAPSNNISFNTAANGKLIYSLNYITNANGEGWQEYVLYDDNFGVKAVVWLGENAAANFSAAEPNYKYYLGNNGFYINDTADVILTDIQVADKNGWDSAYSSFDSYGINCFSVSENGIYYYRTGGRIVQVDAQGNYIKDVFIPEDQDSMYPTLGYSYTGFYNYNTFGMKLYDLLGNPITMADGHEILMSGIDSFTRDFYAYYCDTNNKYHIDQLSDKTGKVVSYVIDPGTKEEVLFEYMGTDLFIVKKATGEVYPYEFGELPIYDAQIFYKENKIYEGKLINAYQYRMNGVTPYIRIWNGKKEKLEGVEASPMMPDEGNRDLATYLVYDENGRIVFSIDDAYCNNAFNNTFIFTKEGYNYLYDMNGNLYLKQKEN